MEIDERYNINTFKKLLSNKVHYRRRNCYLKIDRFKFGKRKYNKRHQVEEV